MSLSLCFSLPFSVSFFVSLPIHDCEFYIYIFSFFPKQFEYVRYMVLSFSLVLQYVFPKNENSITPPQYHYQNQDI